MIAVGIISFSMFRYAGDPVNQIVALTPRPPNAPRSAIAGLDDPVPLQFARYFGDAVRSSSASLPVSRTVPSS